MNEPSVHAGSARPWWREHPYRAAWIALVPFLFVFAAVAGGFPAVVALPLMLPGIWFGLLRVHAMLNPERTFDHNGRISGR